MRTWPDDLKTYYPMTPIPDREDVGAWQQDLTESVPDLKAGEISEAIRWASRRYGHDHAVTPTDIIGWIRERRMEIKAHTAIPFSPVASQEARDIAAGVIRAWLENQDGIERDPNYDMLGRDQLTLPDDEYWSESRKCWMPVGDCLFPYRMRRRFRQLARRQLGEVKA